MTTPAHLAKLRADAAATEALAGLVADWLLATPLGELFEPRLAARAIERGLRAVAEDPDSIAAIVAGLDRARARIAATEGACAGDFVPVSAHLALRDAVGRPWVVERSLVASLLDQPALRTLLRAVLTDAIEGFAARIRALLPSVEPPAAKGLAGAFAGAAKAVAGAVSGSLERQLDERARQFVDGAIARSIARIADQLSDPAQAETTGALRIQWLEALMTEPLERLAAGPRGVDDAQVARDLIAICAAVADDPSTHDRLTRALIAALGVADDATLAGALPPRPRTWLRVELAAWLARKLEALLATDELAAWWARHVEP